MKPLFYPSAKTALFVDGRSFHGALKSLDVEIDYAKLRAHFSKLGRVLACHYYTTFEHETDDETGRRDFNSLKPLLDYLRFNGWRVHEKALKIFKDKNGEEQRRGSVITDMMLDMILAAQHCEQIVLFSGHSDFVQIIDFLHKHYGVSTTVVGTKEADTNILSDYLRGVCDNFYELSLFAKEIARDRAGAVATK